MPGSAPQVLGRLPWQTLDNHRTKGPVKVAGFIFASKNGVSRVPYLKAMVHELVVMVYAAGQTRQPVKASKATLNVLHMHAEGVRNVCTGQRSKFLERHSMLVV